MEFFFGGEIKRRWKRKITCGEENLFFQGRAKARKKNEETKICFLQGRRLRGKYLENTFFCEGEAKQRRKRRIICKRPVQPDDHL